MKTEKTGRTAIAGGGLEAPMATPRLLRLDQKTGDGEWVSGMCLNLSEATGADVLMFVAGVVGVIVKDRAALERMANAEGMTTLHPLFEAAGAIAIDRR